MGLRRLTPAQMAVLNAIIAQRSESWGDDFEYDYMKAQRYLTEKGFFTKYKIDLFRQFEILEQLSKERIIIMSECIVSPTKPNQETQWLSPTEWAWRCFNTEVMEGSETANTEHCSIFIKMSQDDIEHIIASNTSHSVKLKIDEMNPHLSIKIDNGNWKLLSRLHDNKLPIQVLRHAYKNCGRAITRDELIREVNPAIKGKSLRTQVFSDNRAVKSLSPLLIKLKNDSIMIVKTPVELTLADIQRIGSALKKS